AEPPAPLRRVRRREAALHHLSRESSREVLSECAFLNAAFERARTAAPAPRPAPEPSADVVDLFSGRRATRASPYRDEADEAPDCLAGRVGALLDLCREARRRHADATGTELRPGTLHGLLRYACRYALTEGSLGPDLYQLAVAARGFADDSYAHEVWEVATDYPWQTDRPEFTPIDLDLRDVAENVRTIRFRPLTMQRRRRLMKVVGKRPRERKPGDWAERFGEGVICSYPPEDVALEHYGAFLRKRTVRVLSEEMSRAVRFSSSLHDGVDIRETLRNWHEGHIYVRIQQLVRGQPGDVVVIFEDEPMPGHGGPRAAPKYPWLMTWQGEHAEEGDLALYATDPMERVIGPGIGRSLYGGFALHRPPGTMFSVWEDPFFRDARSKAELLLLAALDHTTEHFVVFVAPDPPRQGMRQLARRLGKKIIYTPLGQLSPIALRKIQRFHVLSDHGVRAHAREYIDAP
ncbi:MAG: hypothetical protein KC636_02810, partial [Myxococcales bacterium]|nr:hypothetical protein [Myxococcales bacterium]